MMKITARTTFIIITTTTTTQQGRDGYESRPKTKKTPNKQTNKQTKKKKKPEKEKKKKKDRKIGDSLYVEPIDSHWSLEEVLPGVRG